MTAYAAPDTHWSVKTFITARRLERIELQIKILFADRDPSTSASTQRTVLQLVIRHGLATSEQIARIERVPSELLNRHRIELRIIGIPKWLPDSPQAG